VESGLGAFLDRIAALGAERMSLLVDAGGPPLPDRATAPTTVHVVPPPLSWNRMVRVACVLAGASAAGGDSVVALRSALAAHPPGGPLTCVTQTAPD
jgi:hypothetical protein